MLARSRTQASGVWRPQETAELSLRGTALMARVLLEALDSKAPPPGLLQAAAALHDNALLVWALASLSVRTRGAMQDRLQCASLSSKL